MLKIALPVIVDLVLLNNINDLDCQHVTVLSLVQVILLIDMDADHSQITLL